MQVNNERKILYFNEFKIEPSCNYYTEYTITLLKNEEDEIINDENEGTQAISPSPVHLSESPRAIIFSSNMNTEPETSYQVVLNGKVHDSES